MRFLILSIASIVLAAQNRAADYSIAGVVVNSQTGKPMRNELLTSPSDFHEVWNFD